jgi:hypothetical protein
LIVATFKQTRNAFWFMHLVLAGTSVLVPAIVVPVVVVSLLLVAGLAVYVRATRRQVILHRG